MKKLFLLLMLCLGLTAQAVNQTYYSSLDGKSGSVEVTVEEPDIPVSNITMKPASASLTVGDEETFQAYIEPANATNINSVVIINIISYCIYGMCVIAHSF